MNLLNWNNFASQVFMCSNDDQVVTCPHNLRLHMFVTDFCRCNATKMKLRKLSFTHHQIETCNWKRTFQWLAIQVWWKPRSVLRRLAFIDKGPAVLWHSFAQYFECYIFLFRELELDLTWPYSEIDFSQNNSIRKRKRDRKLAFKSGVEEVWGLLQRFFSGLCLTRRRLSSRREGSTNASAVANFKHLHGRALAG